MKYKAQARYDAANTQMITLKLNRRTDADILEKLEQKRSEPGGRQGYIKSLIKSDITAQK